MENQVRIFRENPIAWWDKPVMRYLRKKYGGQKRLFVALRGVYLALCEIESDFVEQPINFFTQSVGTYAGVTREVAGRCIKILESEGLISKARIKDKKSKRFLTGTIIIMKSLKSDATIPEPLPRIASIGDRQQRGSWATIRSIANDKKLNINKNVDENSKEKSEKSDYYAQLLADKLGDQKSISYYRSVCQRHDPHKLLRKAHEIVTDGKAKNPAAVFVQWLKQEQKKKFEQLQFPN